MIHFALVGCGRIARKHAEILGGGHLPEARLAGVCDILPAAAQAMGEQYDVPWFTDMHAMMAALGDRVDVINILTPSGLHARHTLELAPYRKHLVVEKPMALTLPDADAMIQTCDKVGIKLFVVKQNRYNPPVQKLRQAMDAGRFGKLVMGTVRVRWFRNQSYYDQAAWRGTWAMDGGVFANQASHHIDLLEWFMGEPVAVFAKSRTALVNIECEDTGCAMVTFANGALGIIEATTAARPVDLEGSLSILGEHGTVEIGGFAVNQMKVWRFSQPRADDDLMLTQCNETPPNVYGFGHKAFLQDVIVGLHKHSSSLVDGLVGRRSLELISAIYESIETGREVPLRFQARRCRLGLT